MREIGGSHEIPRHDIPYFMGKKGEEDDNKPRKSMECSTCHMTLKHIPNIYNVFASCGLRISNSHLSNVDFPGSK